QLDEQARAAGIMLLPGAGFDVAPTDCLALHLKKRLPSAIHLALAFTSRGGAGSSRGTLRSAVEMLGDGLLVREDGYLRRAPHPGKTRLIDPGTGPVTMHLFPWGDVFTAYYSTGIPNIEVYTRLAPEIGLLLPVWHRLSSIFDTHIVKGLLRRAIKRLPPGPTAEQRRSTRTYVWGEVSDEQGRVEIARLQGPEAGYSWTVEIALNVIQKTLTGSASPGYQTPASAFGADFILECGGERMDDDSLIG
ncbi:MAG: saccharopine dehydrogenase family protein, partial [Anaerolineales bacterium]